MESILDEALSEFREKRQVGYWTIIGEIIWVKRRFFDEWSNSGLLEISWKGARCER